MPNTPSAKKSLKQDARRRLENQVRKSRIRTHEKKFAACLLANDAEGARTALQDCFSALDKAAKIGSIHKNKADRKKGRLSVQLKKAVAAA